MKKKLDFLPNRENKYSIRKFTVGTASILISSLLFLSANGVADAAEDNQANSEHKQTSTTKDSEQSEHDPDEKDIQRQKEIDELEHEESEVTVDDAEDTDEAAHTDNDDENIEDESAEETETEPSAEENNENDADDSDDEAQRQKEIDELEHEESEVTEEEGDESEEPSQEATDDTEEATTDEDEATKEEENEASDETSNEEESTNENENTDENVDETSDSEDEGEEAPADEGSNEATTDENNQSETQDDDEADHQPVHKSQKAAESDDTTQKDDNETSTETPNEENHESEATDEEKTPDESTPATKPAEDHESDQDDASEEHENTEAEDDKDTTSEDKDTPRTDEGIDTEGKLFPDKEKEEPASDAETRDDKATTNSEQASTETPQITQKDAKKYELTDAKQFKAGIKDEGNKQQFVEDYLKDNDVSQKESQDIAKRVIPNNKDVTSDEVYDALRLKLLKRAAETQDQMQPKATPAESRVRTNNRFVTASIPASRAQDRAVQDQARTDYSKLLNIQKTSEGTAKGNDWTSMNAVKFRLLDNGKVELDVTLNQNEGLSFGFNAIDRYTVKFNDYLKDHVESVTTEGDQLTNKGNGEYEIEYKRALSLVSNGKPLSFKAVINTDDFDPKSALSIRYHRQVNTGILKGADVYNLTFQDFATFLNQYKDVYEEISNFDAVDDTKKEILLSRFENINSLPNLQETAASVRNEGKTMVKDQINNMSNLSDDEKAKYTKQVDDSKNLTDNNNVVKEAQKQDAGNLVNKQKDQGKNGINDLSDLTDDQKSDFNDQIDKAPNKNAIDQIVKKAQQQNTTNVLNNQKTQGNQQLDDLSNLSDDEKSQFKDQIDKANDKAGIDQVLKDAQQQDDKNLLNVQKTNGNKQLDGLSNLTDNEKSQFKKQITDATTKEAIDQAVNDAKARDVQAEAENNLNKAKQTAQTTVDGLTHLTDSNRSDIKKQLQNAKTPEAVTDILKNAQQQDADNQLDEQKQQGTAELNKINNLTEEEKARFRDLISKATTKDAIDQAITDAQTQSSNNVLNNQKSEAQTTLTGLENLTDKEREDFKQQLNEAQTKASIDEIINNAKQQDGSNLLKQQQTEGKTNLAQLHNLTDEEMADFTQQLDEATSKSVIDDVINRAQGQDASNLLSKQRNQGNQQIDAFTHLSDDEKSNYTQQINDAKNQKAIQDVVNKAQQQDASNLLNNQKTDGSKEINGLADLTDDEKAQYNQQVTDAETQEDIEAAINQAKAQNIANKDLSQAKDNAKTALGQLTHLTEDNTTSFNKQLAEAKTPDAVSDIIRKAQQQDASNLLNTQKQQGVSEIDRLADLTDDEKDQFKQQVNDATSQAAIEKIVSDATDQGASNLLNKQKQQGTTSVNGLTNLSDDEKSDFAKRVNDATSKEAIDEAVNEATAKDLQNKAAKDLSDAKRDAQVEIERLTHLTEDNRTNINQQLDSAGTPSDVANIIRDAQQQDADNLLSAQRGEGQGSIDQLNHLSNEAKSAFKEQIGKAATKANIDEILTNAQQQDATNLLNRQKQQGTSDIDALSELTDEEKAEFQRLVQGASNKETIDETVNNAKAQDVKNKAAKDLEKAKSDAATTIADLSHLTVANRAEIEQQLDEAKDPDAVLEVVKSAQDQDASNLLNEQKDQGHTDVNALNHLSDDEKATFNEQVKKATSKKAIDDVIEHAKQQDVDNLLQNQKDEGNSAIGKLTHLSEDEKKAFNEQINLATDKAEIDQIKQAANTKDASNLLGNQKSDARNEVSGLEDLSDNEQSDFNEQINAATTKQEIDQIVADAKAKDVANKDLSSAKQQGQSTVSGLSHLSEDEKSDLSSQINQAKNPEAVADIIQQAQEQDAANLLDSQKSDAHQTVGQLSNLTEEEQTMMNQQIDQAKTKANIDDIISQAKQRDADNLLSSQKQQGIGEIDGLSHLTQEEQATFNEQINYAKDKKAVDDAVASAKAKDAANLLDEQKESGAHEVSGLKDLTNEQRQAFNQRIKDASTKEDIDQVIDDAKAKDASNLLDKQKSAGTNEVNGLKDLSESEQQGFNKRIQDASSKEDIDQIVTEAKAKDVENKDLSDAKQQGHATVDDLSNLTEEQLNAYTEQVDQAGNPEAVADVVKKAQAQDAANLLQHQKDDGTSTVKGLGNLTQEELEDYQDQIHNADNKATIDNIIDKATQQDASNLLNKQKGEGTTSIKGLTHLSEDEVADFEQQIKNANDKATIDHIVDQATQQDATNLLNNQKDAGTNEVNGLKDLSDAEQAEFNQRIKDAVTKEDIDRAVADAKAKDVENKDLSDAKQQGQAAIDQLSNLTDSEQQTLKQQLNDAKSPAAVAEIVQQAQGQDATNLLNSQKANGTTDVGQLSHLTDKQLADYQDQINKANDKATIDDIVEQAKTQDATNLLNNQKADGTNEINRLEDLTEEEQDAFNQRIKDAATKEDIDGAVADAKAKAIANKDLAQAKQDGQATVNPLQHLTDEERTDILEQINNAQTPEAVADIVNKAQETDATNLLNRQKGEGTDTVQALTHLKEEEAAKFEQQITNATDQATIDDIVEKAQQQDAANLLDQQKANGTNEVNGLEDLSKEEQEEFNQRIKGATTKEDIDQAVADAKAKNVENKDLAQAKQEGQDTVNALDHLTDEEISDIKEQLNTAKTPEAVAQIVKSAQDTDATNLLNRQRGESTDTIQALDHLTEEEFNHFAGQINNAKDKETIDSIVEQAKQQDATNLLNRQRGESTDAIQELDHLTEEEFNNFADQINNATDKAEIDEIVERAKQQDATNLLNRQRGESTDAIQELDHLTEEEFDKYANQINNAKDKETIDGIVEEAKAQDADNLLNRQRGEGTDTIQELDHLTEEEFNNFADQINNAKDKATIDSIVEEAKQQDATNLLNRQRGEGTDTIQELNHLTEEEFNNFAEQINNAKDKATIDSIVEEAKAQDADNLLNRQRGEGKDTIQALDYLTEEEFNKYVIQINYAKDKATIDSIVEEAKQQDADNLLNSQKEDGTNEVSNLTDLTESEKETFNKRIKDATTKEEIDKAVADAKAKDIENKDLTEAKSNGKTEVEELNNLSDEESDQVSEDIDNAKTPEEVADIVKAAQDQDASNLLDKQKAEGTTIIKGLDNLRDEEVGTFTDQIKNATDQATIDDIVEEAKDQDADNLLNSQKDDGTNEVNGLKDLTDSEKETFNKRIKDATTKEEIDKAVADAKAKDIENKDLTEAKSNGKTEVEELNNLSDEESDQVSEDIDNAKTPEEVADIVKAAQDQDASNLLDKQKAEGTTIIKGLDNLRDEEVGTFTDQIKNATDQATIDDIVEEAKDQDADNLLNSQKDDGTNEVNGLKDLTDSEKETFNKRIKDATTKEEIDKAVADAKAKDIENKDLTEAKSHGNSELDQLNHLTNEEKAKFKEQINQAKTSEEIADIVKAAQRQDASNLLDNQKADGKDNVDSLKHLSQEEKDKYKHDIDDAKTKEEIDNIINKAKDEDSKHHGNKPTDTNLDDVKKHGKDNVDKLKHLSQDQKDKYKHDIDNAKTKEEIDSIINKAKDEDSKHHGNKPTDTDLDGVKKHGKDDIDNLKHLNKQQKDKYKHDIGNAKTKEEIDNIINKAKDEDSKHHGNKPTDTDLDGVKKHGKANIDKLNNLTPAEKDKYKHDIDDATTSEAVNKVVDKATLQNIKQHSEDEIDNAKHDAHQAINRSPLSESDQNHYNYQIDQSTTIQEVVDTVNEAQQTASNADSTSNGQDNETLPDTGETTDNTAANSTLLGTLFAALGSLIFFRKRRHNKEDNK